MGWKLKRGLFLGLKNWKNAPFISPIPRPFPSRAICQLRVCQRASCHATPPHCSWDKGPMRSSSLRLNGAGKEVKWLGCRNRFSAERNTDHSLIDFPHSRRLDRHLWDREAEEEDGIIFTLLLSSLSPFHQLGAQSHFTFDTVTLTRLGNRSKLWRLGNEMSLFLCH